ncbi:MAG: endolytic transglycosylase MltG [Desulfobacterales bacterium]
MKQRRVWIALATLGVLAGAFGVVARLALERHFDSPAGGQASAESFVVEPGEPLVDIARRLEARGLIRSELGFRLLARLEGAERRLQAGEYAFSPSLSPREILGRLLRGQVRLYRLTVPEGLTLSQIAVIVEKTGLAAAAEFEGLARDPALAKQLGIPAESVEGYLFPETYFFPRGAGARAILEAMVARFRAAYPPEWDEQASRLGLSRHEVVTLASIIEKETADPAERPLIAAVFHNRLKRGMRLETDPTVIYGIRDFDGNLTRRHLETPTPYNTYIIRGLPPGPIANPGKASLQAALFPPESPFLYFVSRNDGTHHFSTTYEEHRRAVRFYQLGEGKAPAAHEKSKF